MFFSYLAKFSQPPFPPIPPVFLASFTEGELLKKFAAAYRMFSDMDEPVSRQDVSDVWEGKPGESRVASGLSNGHVSRQGQWKQSSETLGISEILLEILDGKLMAKAYDFKHPKWLNGVNYQRALNG